jgi:hypothetical protein
MPRRKSASVTASARRSEPPQLAAFHDPVSAARALTRAAVLLNDVHGNGSEAALLAPLLAELAAIARRRGVDVVGLLQCALKAPADADEPVPAADSRDPLNDRLLVASSRACAEIVQLASAEMNRSAATPALFKAMAAAGVIEELTTPGRDDVLQRLATDVPRDAVLTLMYTLADQRQRAELRVGALPGQDARDALFDDLWQVGTTLRDAGFRTDADYDIGLGLAIWTPDEQQIADGVSGLCLTYGRGAVDVDSHDFMVHFDPRVDGAGQAAAAVLYRAHLAERAHPERELVHVDGVLLRQHPLRAEEAAAICASVNIEHAAFHGTVLQFATLVVSEIATLRLLRAGFTPVGMTTARIAEPTNRTRH